MVLRILVAFGWNTRNNGNKTFTLSFNFQYNIYHNILLLLLKITAGKTWMNFRLLSNFYHLIAHCTGGGAKVDDFLEIGGSATIFLTGAHMECRQIFWLDIVDDFDFYRWEPLNSPDTNAGRENLNKKSLKMSLLEGISTELLCLMLKWHSNEINLTSKKSRKKV